MMIPQGGTVGLPTAIPNKLSVPPELQRGYQPQPGSQEAAEIMVLGREAGLKEMARRSDALCGQEYLGQPRPTRRAEQYRGAVYKNGHLADVHQVGPGTASVCYQTDGRGNRSIVTRDTGGNVAGLQPTEFASDKRADTSNDADIAASQPQVADVQTSSAGLTSVPDRIARMDQTIADVKSGKVTFSPGLQGAWDLMANRRH